MGNRYIYIYIYIHKTVMYVLFVCLIIFLLCVSEFLLLLLLFHFLQFVPNHAYMLKWSGVGTTSGRRNCTLRSCASFHLTWFALQYVYLGSHFYNRGLLFLHEARRISLVLGNVLSHLRLLCKGGWVGGWVARTFFLRAMHMCLSGVVSVPPPAGEIAP